MPELFEYLWLEGSGKGLAMPTVGVVGTRAPTAYGRGLAARFAGDLARAGCCVVSGLALGIDAAAHEGALHVEGITIGVLGGGHARFFPRRNRRLAEAIIAAGGGVFSPFPPEQPAYPSQFLARNGIVAALCDAVVVIEAPARSGAINTAGWAAGRIPVFAVPGDVDRAHVAGCHALIRDGATLARTAADILTDLGIAVQKRTQATRAQTPLSPLQQTIVRSLEAGELDVDALVSRTRGSPGAVLAALAFLEGAGIVVAREGLRYALS